ncbi:amino acid ABC transporter ATP-binding protein [Liquorilactobacillus satsumensis]|uniref:Amino acid abc transporter, atp-binding protein n=1 Tax=Liquorilactobacillus satsumensis DSM 16230 = JCM 12392 TaxID=1423801 RepID=A0A0R1V0G4_9LACO|nr:amino acid ABC transporter ATP-binding protein [Liquorilactobacillus satsumensis]KRL99105.1 amino acid abc transporter, atp-binding protein [Liquorilactobacillus satsumensis DSM 16230 = JCM 12392]MCC7666648.1 amino acid ABC transporter ATP-binding protein [Liquorilactobacillus satsumensis]MCP9329229.1 amino acid ABC transporter ATP-binding protein [Liquorilactobacillus satsumensis]MCP9357790.1 amino acid ABC transporter ATP-binding protein [Liquorilactobacillus satsumensis]MCP9371530.1 amin
MLKLENLSKTFGEHRVLDGISTVFPEHETTVVLGPSGSGKSTLLRSLNLLERPEAGRYHFDDELFDFGKGLSNKEILSIRKRTEMVFQEYNLFPHLTVLKNIIEGPTQVLHEAKDTAQKRAQELLVKVGLGDKADAYPSQLSGGQAQRVAIARALAMQPKYILLDEPTSALDPELELEVLKVLRQLAQEKQTLIIVTHNMAFAREVAARVLFIENGQILFDGPKAEFFNTKKQRIVDFISAMTFENI